MTIIVPILSHSHEIIPILIPTHSKSSTSCLFPISTFLFSFPPIPIPIANNNHI